MEFKTIKGNPELHGVLTSKLNVVYREICGEQLTCDLILPRDHATRRYPGVVFVQGCGWTKNQRASQLPNLANLAKKGFVVMTVTHRNTKEGHPFPAYLTDIKCAIKFLKAHGEEYGADPERIGIWGTSSGGNIALMAGMTGDGGMFKTPEFPGISSEVKCVVDFFGPTDILGQAAFSAKRYELKTELSYQFLSRMIGKERCSEEEHELTRGEKAAIRRMSPLGIISAKQTYPPMLVFHGTADDVVSIDQSDRFVEKMQSLGNDVTYYQIDGAKHEGACWSKKSYRLTFKFLEKHLK